MNNILNELNIISWKIKYYCIRILNDTKLFYDELYKQGRWLQQKV